MDIFKEVKERADILKVCDLLGIKLDRSYMTLCPFHKEKSPSFSISPDKQIFKCFGCGKGGDVITLVSDLLNIKPLEAAKFLNNNLGLGINISNNSKYNFNYINTYEQKKKAKEKYDLWKRQSFSDACSYLHILEDNYEKVCKELGTIEKADEFFDNEDVNKYYNETDRIQYYLDFYIYGTEEDILWIKKTKGKVVNYNGRRIRPRNS